MSILKFKRSVSKRCYNFPMEKVFFAEGYFQKYLLLLCKHIEKCSSEIAEEAPGRCKNTENDLKKGLQGVL